MPQRIAGTKSEPTLTSSPDACDYWNISTTFLLRSTLTLSTSKAPGHRLNIDAFISAVEHDMLNLTPKPVRDNLTTHERHGLKQLRRPTDIIMRAADSYHGQLSWTATGTLTNA